MEARKKAEEESMKKLEGRILVMLNELYDKNTPFEYTLSGIELGGTRNMILAGNIAYNNTLLSIHMSRKGL